MKKISISDENLAICAERAAKEKFILKGLPERSLGALIGAPDAGKSRLMHTMAYCLASGVDLLGLLPTDSEPRKVALWTSEEGIYETTKHIAKILPQLPSNMRKLIQENVTLIDDDNGEDKQYLFKSKGVEDTVAISSLIEQLDGIDVLFIDTIRESIGVGSEVDDDVQIRVILEKIIRNAGCAVVYLHHLTKTDAKLSADKLSSTSGSGLSATSAKARVHYTLTIDKAGGLQIDFTKANKLPKSERSSIRLIEYGNDDASIPIASHIVIKDAADVTVDEIIQSDNDNQENNALIDNNEHSTVGEKANSDSIEKKQKEQLRGGGGSVSKRAEPSKKVKQALSEKVEGKQVVVVVKSSAPQDSTQTPLKRRLHKLRKPEHKKI